MKKVAIVGMAQTPLEAAKKSETIADLIYEVSSKALNDAGINMGQVDNIITASSDLLDGRLASSMPAREVLGAAFGDGKNISTIEGDGSFAAIYGLNLILSGAHSTTLIVAHGKPSESDHHLITNAFFDPIYERPLGFDWMSAGGLQARLFMEYSGFNEQGLAEIVIRNRASGKHNPNAQLREEVTFKDILDSEMLAPPIRRLHAAPFADGAAAIVLAEEDVAKKCGQKPAWIEGAASSVAGRMTDRNLWESPTLRRAAKKAYQMAGVADPAKEIGTAEIYEAFSYQEPMWLKELGLENLSKNRVNPSGGCLCGYAPVAAGLTRMIEAALQIRGKASYQVANPKKAMAHGQNSLCAQSHTVWVFGN